MTGVRDRALVLRRFPYGESSLVCHVLTREHGRVHWLAKGAYRATSRYFAVLDFFDTLDATWIHQPERELQSLQSAGIEVRRARVARDLAAYFAGLTMLELAQLGSSDGQGDPRLFEITEAGLDQLCDGVAADAALVEFELAFLHNLGVAPALGACASCGGSAPALESNPHEEPRAAFSSGAGGRLCRSCAVEARAAGRRVGTLPLAVLERAEQILSRRIRAASLGATELESTRDFVARFLEYQLEQRPASYRRFLAAPNRNRPTP